MHAPRWIHVLVAACEASPTLDVVLGLTFAGGLGAFLVTLGRADRDRVARLAAEAEAERLRGQLDALRAEHFGRLAVLAEQVDEIERAL